MPEASPSPSGRRRFLRAAALAGTSGAVFARGFRTDGTPGSITFVGRLFGEAELVRVAQAWQEATGFHRRRPPI